MKEDNKPLRRSLSDEVDSGLITVENLIHVIRGQQVMIDSDLANLYGVETRVLNQAVKRNIGRFPEDFMFQLTKDEVEKSMLQTTTSDSRSQNVILKQGHNIKYLPYAFTDNGIAMLSSVLRSKMAIEVNIRIMRAFTTMRRFVMSNAHIFQPLSLPLHCQSV
ncbi:MAG: ORF6N domain-containing protein [Paramuribaculum sp.]|nr:ORF6N domain-containing protein [Paramuribaculum sp.]